MKKLIEGNSTLCLADDACEDINKKWSVIEREPEIAKALQPQIDAWKLRKGLISATQLNGLCGVEFGDDISRYS